MPEHVYSDMPDEIQAVISYLEASAGLAPYSPHIAGDLKGYKAPETWITVQDTGGAFEGVRTAAPRLDINVYASSKVLAKRIALRAVQDLRGMKNYVTETLVVIKADPSYPADVSDPLTSNPRYVFDLNLWYRPI
jgi:hypothetical protein